MRTSWKLLDMIIPLVIIIGCLGLLFAGINGEVKTILGMAAVWVFKSSTDRIREYKNGH